jgi:hypothetical protein
MSRPRFLSTEKQGEFCRLLMAGCVMETAARLIGCNPATIRREAKRNREFAERIRVTRRTVDMSPIAAMREAVHQDWRAAAWLLERTQPEVYAKRPAKTFSERDVANLLDRVCDIVRREICDAAKYACIRRGVAELAKQTLTVSVVGHTNLELTKLTTVDAAVAAKVEQSASNNDTAPDELSVMHARGSGHNLVPAADVTQAPDATYEPAPLVA